VVLGHWLMAAPQMLTDDFQAGVRRLGSREAGRVGGIRASGIWFPFDQKAVVSNAYQPIPSARAGPGVPGSASKPDYRCPPSGPGEGPSCHGGLTPNHPPRPGQLDLTASSPVDYHPSRGRSPQIDKPANNPEAPPPSQRLDTDSPAQTYVSWDRG
jgi:hypothetical protein